MQYSLHCIRDNLHCIIKFTSNTINLCSKQGLWSTQVTHTRQNAFKLHFNTYIDFKPIPIPVPIYTHTHTHKIKLLSQVLSMKKMLKPLLVRNTEYSLNICFIIFYKLQSGGKTNLNAFKNIK